MATEWTEPRFEFRAFASDLAEPARRLARLSGDLLETHSEDTYILSRLTLDAGVKVRDGEIDVKVLAERRGLLELWTPSYRRALPITGRDLVSEVMAQLGVDLDVPDQTAVTLGTILDVCEAKHALAAFSVTKHRIRHVLPTALAEIAHVGIGSRVVQTIAVESPLPQAVEQLMDELRIADRINESYPAFLQGVAF